MTGLRLVASYNFTTKDPAIDAIRTPFEDDPGTVAAFAVRAGVSYSTVANIFYGKTRSPRLATMVRIARAIGPNGERALIECIKTYGKNGK